MYNSICISNDNHTLSSLLLLYLNNEGNCVISRFSIYIVTNQCCTRGTVLCHSNALGHCNAGGQQVTAQLRGWTETCFN